MLLYFIGESYCLNELLRILEQKRFLESDELTAEQEVLLKSIPKIIVVDWGESRDYTLNENYK